MTLKTGDAEQQVLETTYWWGVPTLFRCPHDPDLANCDIGLVGIPHSAGNGTTEHDQHLGPRAVRHVSPSARRVHNAFGLSPVNRRWAARMQAYEGLTSSMNASFLGRDHFRISRHLARASSSDRSLIRQSTWVRCRLPTRCCARRVRCNQTSWCKSSVIPQ